MKYATFLVLAFAIVSCKDVQKSNTQPIVETPVKEETLTRKSHPGEKLLKQECYICHDPKASMANRIAPPMETIKRHYIDSNTTKEDFTKALIRWVNDPEAESKMPGAHAKFGPMPYMPNPDNAVAQIADYLYDNEIERPEWFEDHFKKSHGAGTGKTECRCFADQDPEKEYAAMGLAYAMEAKTQLGKNLVKAIQEKGIVEAIRFCHTEATKLTDSISVMKNAIIKRVSDKPRNPNNLANNEELGHIASFKKMVTSNRDVAPVVNIEKRAVNFYYPITTDALCLQCHGRPDEQVLPETLTVLTELYPEDKALGYDVNEVRGIWSINFDKDH